MSNAVRATKAYYDKNASSWMLRKTDSFHHEKEFRKLIKYLPPKSSVIDIGCAGGVHVPLFLGIGRSLSYIGLDISKSFLKIAQGRYPQLTFLEANIAERSTLPKKKFDAFFAAAVLMHIPLELWDAMFENIEHLVRAGGYGYLVLPLSHPSGDTRENDPRHFTLLSKAEQKAYLKRRNWRIVASGSRDAMNATVWQWYIVQLPKKSK